MQPSDNRGLLALGVLLAGLGGATALVMIGLGRQRELYPVAVASALTSAVVTAARVWSGDAPAQIPGGGVGGRLV